MIKATTILGIYIGYYSLCIAYDLIFKKENSNKSNKEDEVVIDFGNIEEEEAIEIEEEEVVKPLPIKKETKAVEPVTVEEEEEETVTVEEEEEEEEEETEGKEIDTNIYMEVEGQAIPYELLLREGKDLFTNINF